MSFPLLLKKVMGNVNNNNDNNAPVKIFLWQSLKNSTHKFSEIFINFPTFFSEFLGYLVNTYAIFSHIQRKYDFLSKKHWFSRSNTSSGNFRKNQSRSVISAHCVAHTQGRLFQRKYHFLKNAKFVKSPTGGAL